MVWFKSDDGFWRHRKVRKLGKDKIGAAGLWQLSGTWCADNTTDGFVPIEQVKEFGDTRLRYAKKLVEVGLWFDAEHDGETGFRFHAWGEYQPTKASIEAERSKWQQKKAAQRGGPKPPATQPNRELMSPGDTNGDSNETPPETPQETDGGSPPEFPDPVPVPVPSTSVGGVSYVPARASAPLPRCPKHATEPTTGACRPCGDARRAREAWDTQQAEARQGELAAIRQCRLCDGEGSRYVRGRRLPMSPKTRCDHQPHQHQEPA